MTIITPIKIRNAVIHVKIPYTGPSCIPFIHYLAFDDFSYKCCIFGVSEGYQNITTCIHAIFIISINTSCITARIEKVFAITFPVNTFKIVIKPQRF